MTTDTDVSALETAAAIALARLHAQLPDPVPLWTEDDSRVFRAGFAAGMQHCLSQVKSQGDSERAAILAHYARAAELSGVAPMTLKKGGTP
jgi:hypothetical protein